LSGRDPNSKGKGVTGQGNEGKEEKNMHPGVLQSVYFDGMVYVLTNDAHYRQIQRLGGIVPT